MHEAEDYDLSSLAAERLLPLSSCEETNCWITTSASLKLKTGQILEIF